MSDPTVPNGMPIAGALPDKSAPVPAAQPATASPSRDDVVSTAVATLAMNYVRDRLQEDGTWAGMGAFLAASGAVMPKGSTLNLVLLGLAAGCGAVAMSMKAVGK